jgi:hypothetical protein
MITGICVVSADGFMFPLGKGLGVCFWKSIMESILVTIP